MPSHVTIAILLLISLLHGPQPQSQPRDSTPADVRAAIDRLSTIEYSIRMDAARTIRRASAAIAVPALVEAASRHQDGFVRYRSLVLLSGFNDPRTREVMAKMLGEPNDRIRAVAYAFFEHTPDATILPRLLDALTREEGEFVRPALSRALAAYGSDARARDATLPLVTRGQDFFRSAAIEALGDYKATYAYDAIAGVARLDGPLQDDAVLALGKMGDKKAVSVLAELQRTAPRIVQPAIATAICLVGVNCSSHQGYLTQVLKFGEATPGYQDLLRGAASGLGALAVAGNDEALETLVSIGGPSRDPARAAIALAIGSVALKNTPLTLRAVERAKDPAPLLDLLREAFDMLEEDYLEERFFVTVRRSYWQATEGSPGRKAAEALIRTLEF